MRTDRILIHWACSKIKKSNDDEDTICRMVVEKLANKPGLSYSEIAMTAHKAGQSKLATMVRFCLSFFLWVSLQQFLKGAKALT